MAIPEITQTKSKLVPNMAYAQLASNEQIERAAKALEANGIKVIIAANGEEAKRKLFELIPAGAEVFTGSSMTLEALGVPAEVDQRYNSVRAKLAKMDRATQGREMIKMGATPEWMVGSVHAVTEDGTVVIASNTGSQLAGYAAAAAHVVWVVGAQKIVPNLDEAFKRIREYSLPREDERALQAYGMNSNISKMLIVHREVMPGRTTMIIVKEELGF
ncbi:MAG: LUD domain-containing protein [Chloroflexota bacterium]|nr:LUD domain-containing protein [Chloroflexota bacterium]MBI5702356.1 LUD domain-containing protein [Chloroflexota bacterium]